MKQKKWTDSFLNLFDDDAADTATIQKDISDMFDTVQEKIKAVAKATNVDEVVSSIKESLSKILSDLGKKYGELRENIEKVGGPVELIKACWSLDIMETDEISFEEIIAWVKKYLDPQKHSGACIYLKKEAFSKKRQLHVCFLDKHNEPMLDGSEIHLVVNAKACDRGLKDAFGNKDMVVLK